MDAMWENTVWKKFKMLLMWEVEQVTVAGVRGAEAEDEALDLFILQTKYERISFN